MLVLFLAVVAIGCGGGETPDKPGEKPVPPVTEEVKPTEIKVSGEKAEIEVGEESSKYPSSSLLNLRKTFVEIPRLFASSV